MSSLRARTCVAGLTSAATRLASALGLALSLGALAPAGGLAAGSSVPEPFAGTALWVNQIAPPQTGQQLAAEAASAGARTLYVKAAEGASAELQFSAMLVDEMRAAGESLCAWTFARGQDPLGEAAAAVAAVHDGAQCLIVDAEGEYDRLYGAAQVFVGALRSQLGAGFPIGLASQAEVAQHPTFPYSVFLGPGGFNAVLPQVYWLDFGVSVDAAYAASIGGNSIYGRPILPLGQLYNSPAPAQLTRFRALARAYGAPGTSFFDLDVAQPEELAALRAPLPRIARKAIVAPTLHAGACGDQIVQAQELLNAAGANLPVGGFFGAETARAVSSFQALHRLAPNGVLDPATWRALLRFRPREPSWASAPPTCEQ
jgi:Putative peptidoglycan binding domain